MHYAKVKNILEIGVNLYTIHANYKANVINLKKIFLVGPNQGAKRKKIRETNKSASVLAVLPHLVCIWISF